MSGGVTLFEKVDGGFLVALRRTVMDMCKLLPEAQDILITQVLQITKLINAPTTLRSNSSSLS